MMNNKSFVLLGIVISATYCFGMVEQSSKKSNAQPDSSCLVTPDNQESAMQSVARNNGPAADNGSSRRRVRTTMSTYVPTFTDAQMQTDEEQLHEQVRSKIDYRYYLTRVALVGGVIGLFQLDGGPELIGFLIASGIVVSYGSAMAKNFLNSFLSAKKDNAAAKKTPVLQDQQVVSNDSTPASARHNCAGGSCDMMPKVNFKK